MFARMLLTLTILTSAPAIALACMNAMYLDGDDAVQQIKEAERLLAAGKHRNAARLVDEHRYHFEGDGLQRRALIVRASVSFRAPKHVYRSPASYIGFLEDKIEMDKTNPLLIARLAEGYSLTETTVKKATEMLEDLATRELMPDAFAYVTLGNLRSRAGDTEGASAAFERCRKMTKNKKVCKATKGKTHKPAKRSQPRSKLPGKKLRPAA